MLPELTLQTVVTIGNDKFSHALEVLDNKINYEQQKSRWGTVNMKEEILLFSTTRMDLVGFVLSEME